MENCYDAIGIFLCIHINFRYQAIMQRRNLTCLDVLVHNTVYIAWNKKIANFGGYHTTQKLFLNRAFLN